MKIKKIYEKLDLSDTILGEYFEISKKEEQLKTKILEDLRLWVKHTEPETEFRRIISFEIVNDVLKITFNSSDGSYIQRFLDDKKIKDFLIFIKTKEYNL